VRRPRRRCCALCAGRVLRSARATSMRRIGHGEPHRPSCPAFSSELYVAIGGRGAAIAPHAEALFLPLAPSTAISWRARAGLSMLVLEGRDSAAEAAAFPRRRHRPISSCSKFRAVTQRGLTARGTKVAIFRSPSRAMRQAPELRHLHLQAALPHREFLESGHSSGTPTPRPASPALCWSRKSPDDHRDFLAAFTGAREVSRDPRRASR